MLVLRVPKYCQRHARAERCIVEVMGIGARCLTAFLGTDVGGKRTFTDMDFMPHRPPLVSNHSNSHGLTSLLFPMRYRSVCSLSTLIFVLIPRCLIDQTRAALAGEIAPEPLVLDAAPILQLRQEHDVNKRPDEPGNNSCEPDSA